MCLFLSLLYHTSVFQAVKRTSSVKGLFFCPVNNPGQDWLFPPMMSKLCSDWLTGSLLVLMVGEGEARTDEF